MLRSEENARIHAVATMAVVALGLGVGIQRHEWIAIALTVGLVWSLEAMNTALEALCDIISPEHRAEIGRAKDLAAGGVLVSAITAVVVAALIFVPRLLFALAS